MLEELPMIERATSWADAPVLSIALVILFAMLIIGNNIARNYHREILRNFFRENERATYAEAENTTISNFLLITAATITMGLFAALTCCRIFHIAYGTTSLWIMLFAVVGMFLWLLLQNILFSITGYCINRTHTMKHFIHSFIIVFIVCGALLFPIVVGMTYAPDHIFNVLIYIGFGIIILCAIVLIAKCLQFFFNGIDTACYLFLYLCTLEILPILLMQKVVETIVQNVIK